MCKPYFPLKWNVNERNLVRMQMKQGMQILDVLPEMIAEFMADVLCTQAYTHEEVFPRIPEHEFTGFYFTLTRVSASMISLYI